jgi:hypothetical protein
MRRIPGLRRYSVTRDLAGVRGAPPCYLVTDLEWASMDELRATFASPEGQEMASVRIMIYEPVDGEL